MAQQPKQPIDIAATLAFLEALAEITGTTRGVDAVGEALSETDDRPECNPTDSTITNWERGNRVISDAYANPIISSIEADYGEHYANILRDIRSHQLLKKPIPKDEIEKQVDLWIDSLNLPNFKIVIPVKAKSPEYEDKLPTKHNQSIEAQKNKIVKAASDAINHRDEQFDLEAENKELIQSRTHPTKYKVVGNSHDRLKKMLREAIYNSLMIVKTNNQEPI